MHEPFEQLIFSGGGVRCFWYGGFLDSVREPLRLQPKRISGVSGGALSAACFIAECGESLLRNMGEAFEGVDHNVDIAGDEPGDRLTPHQTIYRRVVEQTISEQAEATIADGPQFQVLVGYPLSPRWPRLSTIPLMAAYILDLQIRSTPHLKFTKRLGMKSELVDARQAARERKLVSLICNAAVIPPVFKLQGWNGNKVVDGGLACKAPLPTPDYGRTLVLLTRRFRNLPKHPRRVYAQVSRSTPADKLDFTKRDDLERTWCLGQEDGKAYLEDGRFVSERDADK